MIIEDAEEKSPVPNYIQTCKIPALHVSRIENDKHVNLTMYVHPCTAVKSSLILMETNFCGVTFFSNVFIFLKDTVVFHEHVS